LTARRSAPSLATWRPTAMLAVVVVALMVAAYALNSPWIAGIVFIGSCLTPSTVALARRRFDPGEPIHLFLAYLALSIGLRGMIVTEDGSYILSPLYDVASDSFRDLVVSAFAIALLGLVGFLVGYGSRWGEGLSRHIPVLRGDWSATGIRTGVVVGTVLGVSGVLILVSMVEGGLAGILTDLASVASQGAGEPYFVFPLMWCFVVAFLVLWTGVLVRRRSLTYRVVLSVYAVGVFFLYLITASKWLVFTVVMCMFLTFHYLKRRVGAALLAALVGGFIALWPVFYAYQLSMGGRVERLPAAVSDYVEQGVLAPVIGRSYGMDSFLLVLQRILGGAELRYGATMQEGLYFFIPRALWSDKPVSFSKDFGTEFLGHTPNADAFASPSLFGELFLNFHVVGVVGGMWIVGILQRAAYAFIQQHRGNPASVLVFAVTWLAFVHLVEGSIAAQVIGWLAWLVPLLVVMIVVELTTSRGLAREPTQPRLLTGAGVTRTR